VEARFKGELEALAAQRLEHLSAKYLDLLKTAPDDAAALAKLGVLYAENGLFTEALEQYKKILAKDAGNALAHNNIGNVHFLLDRMDDAKAAYEAALKAEPADAGILSNLARVLLKLGKKAEAKKMFQKAVKKDPRVLRKYNDLASDLGIVK
jgi:tetratricopeptide (TPR) repeat protein